MTEAARLVDELTTLLYEVVKRWQLQDGLVCEIVVCGACRKKADKPESVVHESDCPVYRLIRAEEANTAVIRANAEEIADLEDVRDGLEAQVNAMTAENERGQQAFADLTLASVERINALEAERDEWKRINQSDNQCAARRLEQAESERDALAARLAASEAALERSADRIMDALDCLPRALDGSQPFSMGQRAEVMLAIESLRAALAASSGEPAPVTTRTVQMRCHCGRGVTIGADPWCEGCVQSAATCDCVPLAASSAEGES